MNFDLFHSISDPVIAGRSVGPAKTFQNFLKQVQLAESLHFDTVWIAESHFSSETQKSTSVAAIPNYRGEVGLNADSFQLLPWIMQNTAKINVGTAIHNIVGGGGGPIASADRVNMLRFYNAFEWQRILRIGIASGRFPYQNTPFGIGPRTEMEVDLWPLVRSAAFLEAVEIFLRLLKGEELASTEVGHLIITEKDIARLPSKNVLLDRYRFPAQIPKFWKFEQLKLVPEPGELTSDLRIVLGSADPLALEIAQKYWDVDLFNLSFTPPDKIEALHKKLADACHDKGYEWTRRRLPRTVLIFPDSDSRKAHDLGNQVLDAYIEAMRGTAFVPDKSVGMRRRLPINSILTIQGGFIRMIV